MPASACASGGMPRWVIVEGWQRVKARPTGKSWETNFVHIYTLENDMVVKVREYYNTAPMVQAFTA